MNERTNTDLWIINRAIDILARDKDFRKRTMGAWMERYRNRLARGNYDADHVNPFCDRGWYRVYYGRLFTSHFYDPDSMTNWRGETARTARSEGSRYFEQAGDLLQRRDYDNAFYYLGISLHYLSDITMPFHAANFTYLSSSPWGYHTETERYAATFREEFRVTEAQAGYGVNASDPGQWIHQAAAKAKTAFPALWNPTIKEYWKQGRMGEWQRLVRPVLGQCLKDAQRVLAGYLHMWFQAYATHLDRPVGLPGRILRMDAAREKATTNREPARQNNWSGRD